MALDETLQGLEQQNKSCMTEVARLKDEFITKTETSTVHFTHVTSTLLSIMSLSTERVRYLMAKRLELDEKVKTRYEKSRTNLDTYFDLIRAHDNLREKETNSLEGYFPEQSGGNPNDYIEHAKRNL